MFSLKLPDKFYRWINSLKQSLSEQLLEMPPQNSETTIQESLTPPQDSEINIQAKLFASPAPINEKFPRVRVNSLVHPIAIKGSDFHDCKIIDDDHFLLFVSDISSCGTIAALFMTLMHTLIKSDADTDIATLFADINNLLCENNDSGMFVTAAAVCHEISIGKLIYVNAGHAAPLIVHANGETEFLKERSEATLGVRKNISYRAFETKLQAGDLLILYTDGVTDALNEREECYSEQRLAQLLSSLMRKGKSEYFTVELRRDVARFVGNRVQSDDITVVTLKILD